MESRNDDDNETPATATISTSSMEFRNRVPDQMTKRDRQREERERRQYSTHHDDTRRGDGIGWSGVWCNDNITPSSNKMTSRHVAIHLP
mmetsp:Transcript_34497/g.39392  ORF Transcript_34497/g.39392 Transcript_34497/m.39392 type:complete len:89 (+) Transcript_34497:252-518(+)